jgi:deoxyribodipyrimidine photo-lyase
MKILLWFTQDLRLNDHPALAAAARDASAIYCLYTLDENNPWPVQGAGAWWLHQSLLQLQAHIAAAGGQLLLRRGDAAAQVMAVAQELGVDAVHITRAYDPWNAQLQRRVHQELGTLGIPVKRFSGYLLLEPDSVMNKQGKPFQVFTPYYQHCLGLLPDRLRDSTRQPPATFAKAPRNCPSDTLHSWALLPERPNWAAEFSEFFIPGEAGAQQQLYKALQEQVASYSEQRDIPSLEGTSRLSAHLHFGDISPAQIWQACKQHFAKRPESANSFLRQLIWREFSYYLLHHWPHIDTQPFKPAFAQFPWQDQKQHLKAWQHGLTGYPIVDAGMRQLWRSGWMHNRVRMITASFLTKHLRLHWLHGARWFWDTLVDADLANNSAGWQWVAGSGADAAPYFRIFNPILQGEKFDPQGDYIRTWVPELARLPSAYIHKPWLAPLPVLQQAGICLGQQYPKPIVEHDQARQAALAAYALTKN